MTLYCWRINGHWGRPWPKTLSLWVLSFWPARASGSLSKRQFPHKDLLSNWPFLERRIFYGKQSVNKKHYKNRRPQPDCQHEMQPVAKTSSTSRRLSKWLFPRKGFLINWPFLEPRSFPEQNVSKIISRGPPALVQEHPSEVGTWGSIKLGGVSAVGN